MIEDDVCYIAGQGSQGKCCEGLVCTPVGQFGSMCWPPKKSGTPAIGRVPRSAGQLFLLTSSVDRFVNNEFSGSFSIPGPLEIINMGEKSDRQGWNIGVRNTSNQVASAVVQMESIHGVKSWNSITLSPGKSQFLGEDRPSVDPNGPIIQKPWYTWKASGGDVGTKPLFPAPTVNTPYGALAIGEQYTGSKLRWLYLWNRDAFSSVRAHVRSGLWSNDQWVCLEPGSMIVAGDSDFGQPWVQVLSAGWWQKC